MPIEIRKAKLDDATAIANIYNQYLGVATMDLIPYTKESVEQTIGDQNERECFLVAFLDSSCIGWGQIKKYSDRKGYHYACETAVYLHEDFLGKGYGSTLKKAIIETCRQLDYKHLVAKIQADNEVSIHYNRRLGYDIVGTQKRIGHVDGNWKDVVIMQLLID